MQCPYCGEELTIVDAEIADSNVEVNSATEVNISVSFTLSCQACGEELGIYEFNNDQDIGDFVDAHDGHDFDVDLYDERFGVLESNGHISVGAEATIRVVCEDCSKNSYYEWRDYESLNDVLEEIV